MIYSVKPPPLTAALCDLLAVIYAARRLYRLAVSPFARAERRIDVYLRELTTPPLKGKNE